MNCLKNICTYACHIDISTCLATRRHTHKTTQARAQYVYIYNIEMTLDMYVYVYVCVVHMVYIDCLWNFNR